MIDAAAVGRDLVVQAGAGAGKTSTLVLVGEAMARQKVAYIAYNRVTADDAKRRFPKNVKCSTAHGLARDYLQRYRERLNDTRRQRAEEKARLLGINGVVDLASTKLLPRDLARIVTETVTTYCLSSDPELTVEHVPLQTGIDAAEHVYLAQVCLPFAQRAWNDIRRADGKLKFEHDYYFKMWALSNPILPYDAIMLDEAQDTNPVLAKVIADQRNTQKILVGDSCQQLYAWRGAVDAMDNWRADQRLTLSQSWRFGQAIADEANRWLSLLGTDLRLQGNPQRSSSVGPIDHPDAILCRTNSEAVTQLMATLQAGRRPALVGGGTAIRRLAEAARDLKGGRRPAHRELFAFTTWGEVQEYAENDHTGRDLRPFVDLIDEHGVDMILHTINNAVDDEGAADIVISTAHKSKGREWDSVKIAEDFREPLPDDDGKPGEVPSADAMLAYVALTRAKHRLDRTGVAWVDNYAPSTRRHAPIQASAPHPRAAAPSSAAAADPAFGSDARAYRRSVGDHVRGFAGEFLREVHHRTIAGNVGENYTTLVFDDQTHGTSTLVTVGLGSTVAPTVSVPELAITVASSQTSEAGLLLDRAAETLMVSGTGFAAGHSLVADQPIVEGTQVYGAIAQLHPFFAPEFATILDYHGRDGGSIVTLWPIIGEYELDYLDRNGSDDLVDAWVRQGTPVADLYRRPAFLPPDIDPFEWSSETPF
ncbi:UvrD-helicase domain-containing protein [Nocardia fluminea]|uniref:UvrD-helicase domain-containing protein n=1 Tax=Nocardia fluminea TaxID=134984 RepID=UPI0033BFE27E